MAKRPVFLVDVDSSQHVSTKLVDFTWYSGFSIQQKQRSIQSLHESFLKNDPNANILEASSKSTVELGKQLSAFHLTFTTKNTNQTFTVEAAFQASKVFEQNGPFRDILQMDSRLAKRDPRLKNSGKLVHFDFFGQIWDLEPKTAFYDWLYMNALSLHSELVEQVVHYDAFTDIEFNPDKSINCQAGALALFVSLFRKGMLEQALSSVDEYHKMIGN